MRALLDVNMLISLLDPEHVNYAAAHRWLAENLADGWASCPLTENGCLRVLTNPRYRVPWTPSDVLDALAVAKASKPHEFWPDDLSITDTRKFDWHHLRGHQQITDVYLLALAVAHSGKLVTFDQGIRRGAVRDCGPERLVTLAAP